MCRPARSRPTSCWPVPSTVAIGPADVNLKEGTNTIVYAWGSAARRT